MCRKYQSSYGTVWVKCTEEVILVELKTCQHSYCSTINDLIKNQTSILILLQLWDGNDLKLRIVDTKWTSIKVVGQKPSFLNVSFHLPCQKILIYFIQKLLPKNHSLTLCFYVLPLNDPLLLQVLMLLHFVYLQKNWQTIFLHTIDLCSSSCRLLLLLPSAWIKIPIAVTKAGIFSLSRMSGFATMQLLQLKFGLLSTESCMGWTSEHLC